MTFSRNCQKLQTLYEVKLITCQATPSYTYPPACLGVVPQRPPCASRHKAWDPIENERNFQRWCTFMAAGEFETAWQINDEEDRHWPSAHRLWNHDSIAGRTVQLHTLHGFGDVVQMMRFMPLLNDLGCRVQIVCRPELRCLISHFEGAEQARLILAGNEERYSDVVRFEMMELLHAFRITLADLPLRTNYLSVPKSIRADIQSRMDTRAGRRVGIVWSGSAWDPERWLPFESLRPLLKLQHIDWWSMQGPSAAEEARDSRLQRFDKQIGGGLLELAAGIANLDLLITVDTLAAHLAGALQIPTWVLLKHNADWRWFTHRSDSPWYPTLKLIRQLEPGTWGTVLEQLTQELST